MTDLREAAEIALEALDGEAFGEYRRKVVEQLRQALAQPEQEPVSQWYEGYNKGFDAGVSLTPPKREWVGLTDEEMEDLWDRYAHMEMMRAIEAKLKEKNFGSAD